MEEVRLNYLYDNNMKENSLIENISDNIIDNNMKENSLIENISDNIIDNKISLYEVYNHLYLKKYYSSILNEILYNRNYFYFVKLKFINSIYNKYYSNIFKEKYLTNIFLKLYKNNNYLNYFNEEEGLYGYIDLNETDKKFKLFHQIREPNDLNDNTIILNNSIFNIISIEQNIDNIPTEIYNQINHLKKSEYINKII